MKKKFYLVGMLAAGLTFAGCTDDIDDATGGNNQNAVLEGYVKVAINLPTTSGQNTRTEKNDQFDNGTANEYNVGTDNIIAFFEGTDETSATFKAAYSLTPNFGNVNEDQNITTTSDNVIMEAPAKTSADNTLYALVILNANTSVSLDGTSLKIGSSTVSNFEGLTTALASQEVSTFIGNNKDAFMMTNAPMAKVSGSDSQLSTSQDVTTLVPVTVYPSEADAQAAAQADQIYVERAVAKVTVSAFPSELTTIDEGNVLSNAQVELKGWVLDNTNTSLKVVRDVEDQTNGWTSWTSLANTNSIVSENRFFGTTSPFRVYWGIDGNYGSNESDGLHNITTPTDDDKWNTAIKDEKENPIASYCFENTFSGNTEAAATRVIFAYTVTPNIKEDGTSVGTGETAATDFILFGKSSAVYTKQTFLAWCNEYMNDLLPETVDAYTLNTDALNTGKTFDDEADLYGTNGLFSAGVDESNAASVLAKLQEVKFYKDNVMYAGSAYIKHFGEYYTPNPGTNESGSRLGRYGVLRNNWYELNVTKVGIGSPDIPDDTGTLDEEESYINVEINILSWAKREQNVDL